MRRFTCFALVFALVLGAAPARAQDIKVYDFKCATANVAVTTTSEITIIASNITRTPRDEAEVTVIAWAQLTTGTMTTAVTPRIRRDSTTSGTLVNEANAVTIGAAAGQTEQFFAMAAEQRATTTVQYNLTLQQTAANADGSALQACILVLAR